MTRVKKLPMSRQRDVVRTLNTFLAQDDATVVLTAEQKTELRRRLAKRREYASSRSMKALFKKFTQFA